MEFLSDTSPTIAWPCQLLSQSVWLYYHYQWCSFMNHLFRSINGIFIGHESDHCLAWSVTESVSLAVFSLSVVQFYEPFVKKPKWNFYIAGPHDTFEYMLQKE